ncbi:MAG: hypothetical protein CME23_07810 [Gemmatimonadetes bacterium]|nr:hypothetical protein [Gemmatimonadota bacterium]
MTASATILDAIGDTPLLKLNRVTDSLDADIFVKCEFMNPGGSIKDRMALCMIEGAERRGDLQPGGTILDQSTGNTGPALAFVDPAPPSWAHRRPTRPDSAAHGPRPDGSPRCLGDPAMTLNARMTSLSAGHPWWTVLDSNQ